MTFTWVDGPFGGTPQTAANLNAAMGVSDAAIATAVSNPASQTTAQLNATYAPLATLLIDGGNSTSIYTTTFNLDGGSAA